MALFFAELEYFIICADIAFQLNCFPEIALILIIFAA